MKVTDLNKDELEQLRWNYFYDEDVEHNFEFPYQIPDEVLFEHYAHISFVKEDFFCNL